MAKNYLKIALRFMLRQKGFSIINIAGLTIGITCSLLIILYIHDELSYDTFHPDAERIYRLGVRGVLEGKKITSAQTGLKLAESLEEDISEIESTVRIVSWKTFPVRLGDKSFTEDKLLLVDDNFFRFFNFKLVHGNPDSVLLGERKVVITESTAKRYFNYKSKGDRSPIGKTLSLAQGFEAKVTGIAADPPLNSHMHFTSLLSIVYYTVNDSVDYMSRHAFTYFKMKPGKKMTDAMSKFNKIIEYKIGAELEKLHNTTLATFKAEGNDVAFFTQRLLDIHLRSQLSDEVEPNGDVQYLYTFGLLALLITVLACINFMN